MPQYRFSRTMATGWNVRLEYLTWDTNYGGAVTDITEPALVELGEHTAEFDNDGLPYGLCAPQKLSLRLNYSLLPSAMRGYLKYGYDTTLPPEQFLKRNTWWLWTDRGTNGATYYLEFVGCEETSEGVDLEPGPGNTYEYSVELVDAFYHAMKTCTGYEMFRTVTPSSSIVPARYQRLFNILVTNETGRNVFQQSVAAGDQMISADDLISVFAEGVSVFMNAKYMRSPTAGYPNCSILGASTLQPVFTSALELKSSTVTSLPRTTDTTLTGSTLYLNWKTQTQLIDGGISARLDKYGWGRDDVTPWDILHDLAETCGVKIGYEFQFSAPFNSVVVACNVRRVGSTLTYGDSAANVFDTQLGADKMTERAKIIKRGSGIQKSEIQFESEFDEDAKAVTRITSATRGSRSMNIEPIVHNIPTYQISADDNTGRYGPVLQTNLLYSKRSGDNNTYVLAHENTRYRYLPGASGAYVEATTTAGSTPIRHKDDDENVGEYRIQLNAIQTAATMQSALAKFGVFVFGAEQNGIVETSWNLLHTTAAMPHKLGAIHDLSYAQDNGAGGTSYLASGFDEMAWQRCILTKSAVNYTTGECAVTYYVLTQSGNFI